MILLLFLALLAWAGPVGAQTQEELGAVIVRMAVSNYRDPGIMFVRQTATRTADEEFITVEFKGVDQSLWQTSDKLGSKTGSCYAKMEAAMRAMEEFMPGPFGMRPVYNEAGHKRLDRAYKLYQAAKHCWKEGKP